MAGISPTANGEEKSRKSTENRRFFDVLPTNAGALLGLAALLAFQKSSITAEIAFFAVRGVRTG